MAEAVGILPFLELLFQVHLALVLDQLTELTLVGMTGDNYFSRGRLLEFPPGWARCDSPPFGLSGKSGFLRRPGLMISPLSRTSVV